MTTDGEPLSNKYQPGYVHSCITSISLFESAYKQFFSFQGISQHLLLHICLYSYKILAMRKIYNIIKTHANECKYRRSSRYLAREAAQG